VRFGIGTGFVSGCSRRTDDRLSDAGIPNIEPFALAGVTVSNIHWVLAAGSGGST
jgi:hypothetical protein